MLGPQLRVPSSLTAAPGLLGPPGFPIYLCL